MPSFFRSSSSSRRRGSSAQPPLDRNVDSNAAIAAAAAVQRRPSIASLSSAAAAAALRSSTTTPESIGNLQTKRMMRRGSVTSIGSGSQFGGSVAGNNSRASSLTRPGSSASMSARSFRSQSPGRNGAVPPAANAPPVPALPRNVPSGHKRSSSVEVPARAISPSPQDGRSMSMDRRSKPHPPPTKPPGSHRNSKRLSDVAEELERSDSTRNRNFSRLMASPTNSPPASPIVPRPGDEKSWNNAPKGTGPLKSNSGKGSLKADALSQKIARIQAAAAAANGSSTPRAMSPSPIDNSTLQKPEQETVMVFDPATRKFVPTMKDKSSESAPLSPTLRQAVPLAPGTYDPSTRTIVPSPKSNAAAKPASQPALGQTSWQSPAALVAPVRPSASRNITPVSIPTANSAASYTSKQQPSSVHVSPAAQLKPSSAISPPSPVAQTSPTPAYVSASPPGGQSSIRNRGLSPSPSPARSARFSSTPTIDTTKHVPPSRDLSPVKSALKHSPAPSVRAASPLANYPPVGPASEISDTASQTSQDGGSLSVKKKKTARVSFEEQPQEIAPANASTIRKPSLERSVLEDEDDDEIMKPRPALPSFGSVRRGKDSPDTAEKVTEVPPARTAVSSDHALGGILVNASEGAKTISETPAQKSAEHARGDSNVSFVSTASTQESGSDHEVPAINLLPPTPGEEGKPFSEAASSALAASEEDEPPAAEQGTPVLSAINEDSDDNNNFSDAAEDLSELDNGGFISLNAVAISPIAKGTPIRPTSHIIASPPASPTMPLAVKKTRMSDDGRGSGDWTEATAYWSKLSKQQRDQIERDHMSSDDEARPTSIVKKPAQTKKSQGASTPAAKPIPKPAMKKSMRAEPAPAAASTTANGDGSVHMRRSMRGEGVRESAAPQRAASESRPVSQAASSRPPITNRLSSLSVMSNTSTVSQDSSYSKVGSKAKPAQATPVVSARLKKELANDSDSESSFKKKRRPANSSGRYAMKRSMRGAADAPATAAPVREVRPASPDRARGKDSFSLRSLSPSGSLFNRNRGEKIRESIRSGSVDAGSSRMTLRAAPNGKSSGRPTASRQSSAQKSSGFRSRFVDSDDEDESPPIRSGGGFFRSRFADSDDEGDDGGIIRADLTPVRGIPRRGDNDGDSTDLEDEADEAEDPRKASRRREKVAKPAVPDPAEVDRAMALILAQREQNQGQAAKSTEEPKQSKAAKVNDEPDMEFLMEAARKKLGIAAPPSKESKVGPAFSLGSLRGSSGKDAIANGRPEPKSLASDSTLGRDSTSSAHGYTPSIIEKKKRGLMDNIFRRNRTNSSASMPQLDPNNSDVPPVPSVPASPRLSTPTRPSDVAAATDMPASPSTPKTSAAPASVVPPATPPTVTAAASTDTPSPLTKFLNRRSNPPPRPTPHRETSNYSTMTAPPDVRASSDWASEAPPLPRMPSQMSAINGNGNIRASSLRPNTSDGNDAPHRRSSVRFLEGDDDKANGDEAKSIASPRRSVEVYSQRTGKKKKFGLLRRAFRLDD